MKIKITFLLLGFFVIYSCKKKDPEVNFVDNNNAPYYDKVARVKIENYVNRLFIDLIGREPFDSEMQAEVDKLIANNLAISTREELITKLQKDKTYRPGDSSYCIAYHKRLYDLLTVRLCEAIGEPDFMYYRGLAAFGVLIDSLNGNWASYYAGKRNMEQLYNAAKARWHYMSDSIQIEEYCSRLIYNSVTFQETDSYMGNEDNTIIYTFNDLLHRQPTAAEFAIGRDMILLEKSGILFGKSGHSKGDYMYILTHCNEFYEGTIKWLYKTFLARNPNTQEISQSMAHFPFDKDIQKIQLNILKTNEYANFK